MGNQRSSSEDFITIAFCPCFDAEATSEVRKGILVDLVADLCGQGQEGKRRLLLLGLLVL